MSNYPKVDAVEILDSVRDTLQDFDSVSYYRDVLRHAGDHVMRQMSPGELDEYISRAMRAL